MTGIVKSAAALERRAEVPKTVHLVYPHVPFQGPWRMHSMSWRFRVKTFAGALALCLVFPLGAHAEGSGKGWYVSGNVGAAFAGAIDLSDETQEVGAGGALTTSRDKAELTTDIGYGLDAALGYAWRTLRLEGEVSWLRLGVDELKFGESANVQVDVEWGGDVSALGLMANGWYDIDTGTQWVPYFGGGLGAARVETGLGATGTITDLDDSEVTRHDGSITTSKDWVFAYQIGAGVGYWVSDAAVVQLGYRFLGTSEGDFRGTKARFQIHRISVGVRYRF